MVFRQHVSSLNNAGAAGFKKDGSNARAWIDTFFFRAMAMVPPTERMVLNMEYTVPSITIRPQSFGPISGRTDYTAIIAKPGAASESF
ncbi:hypothetical protein M413DRAFT_446463 [Hebeloma cylindrosporum]|uniref:Uncharacterized protein n=1 Tax=Hebeloma cylindrosporum TaxID=76867 RepID=A0A0C2XRK5_HEBCY|nr:hypothetical protein M413DRAFT_446463 [Hebeloma cylindrosporum h7]